MIHIAKPDAVPQAVLKLAPEGERDGYRWIEVLANALSGTRLERREFWIFQSLIWFICTIALMASTPNFSGQAWPISMILGRTFLGFLLTTLLAFCYRHRFTRRLLPGRRLLWIVALNVVIALLGVRVWKELVILGNPDISAHGPFSRYDSARFFSLLIWNVAYAGVQMVLNSHSAILEASKAREAVRAAELKQLQTQLNPHFLFNALNTVVASLEAGSPARDMVKNLADYLRFSLHEARPLEPLSRELDALEWYLELQRVRFQDGLECRIVSSPAAMRALVPPMLVQPLLENAFKYGPMSSPRPLRVNVEAIVAAGWLEIRVTNSGGWVPPGSVDSHGSGLANIRRRLSLVLGVEDALRVEEGAESVSVTIRIPAASLLP